MSRHFRAFAILAVALIAACITADCQAIVARLSVPADPIQQLYVVNAADPVTIKWQNRSNTLFVRVDSHLYPVAGTPDISVYVGLWLLDPAAVRNCRRPSGALTTSTRVFVGGGGAGYVYIKEIRFKAVGAYHVLEIRTPDGDVVCDNPLVSDPTDSIFRSTFSP